MLNQKGLAANYYVIGLLKVYLYHNQEGKNPRDEPSILQL